MYFYILVALILISLINFSDALYYTVTQDKYNIAGLPMQFNITVTDSAYPIFYRFGLAENITNSTIYLEDTIGVTKNYIFPNTTKPGFYRLKIEVFLMLDMIKIMRINGPSHIDFEVKDQLGGNIKFSQENLRQSALKKFYVACFNQISFKSEIDDFHNYFQNVTFNWFVNGTLVPNATDNQLNYTLKTENTFNIATTFTATFKDSSSVKGRNELNVVAFKPLDSLNLTGIPNISWKRNKNLEIYVNFVNGSKPFWYCYQIFSDDKINLLCNDPFETTQDYFKVSKRFSRNGTYYLKIKAGNIVTKLEKSFPISVIDFEKKSQILFIIIPITSLIFVMAIMFAGVLFHIKNKHRFITEVADFNFEQKSQVDNLSEETFFQRLKKTFKSSMRDLFKKNDEQTLIKRLESVNNIDSESIDNNIESIEDQT